MDKKKIVVIGGGTVSYMRSHIAVSAPAYGGTAKRIGSICREEITEMETKEVFTKMAGGRAIETIEEMSSFVDELVKDTSVKIVFFSAAMVDYSGDFNLHPLVHNTDAKHAPRPESEESHQVTFYRTEKIIEKIRATRKDIFLVGFKQTDGLSEDEQYIAGLGLCKRASCNLVLANDLTSHVNMIITPEEARYHVTKDRQNALRSLVKMSQLRSHLTFTRSTVVSGDSVDWNDEAIPSSLKTIVNHCINEGAYKPFNGATVGHFAHKINDTTFLTSKRRTNFNDLNKVGLVRVETDGPDTVIAYGAKPSVGGQSQRIIFHDHKDMDCVVHFHSPKKKGSSVPERSQYEVECGSHECGRNTSEGLGVFGNLKAVYLQEHGPNIVFNKDIDPQEVIDFINSNFDLSKKTGGYVSIKNRLNTSTLQMVKDLI